MEKGVLATRVWKYGPHKNAGVRMCVCVYVCVCVCMYVCMYVCMLNAAGVRLFIHSLCQTTEAEFKCFF